MRLIRRAVPAASNRGFRRRGHEKRVSFVIELQKMNKDRFLVNHNQIECIELIPECKVVMMNHDYYLVRDTVEEIIQKIADYNAKVQDIHREISIVDRR